MSEGKKIDDGGPAFPTNSDVIRGGMTLREYYAGQAIAGLLAGAPAKTYEDAANESVDYADALISALKVTP